MSSLVKCTVSVDRDDVSPFVVGKLYQITEDLQYVEDNNGNDWGLTQNLKHDSDEIFAAFVKA